VIAINELGSSRSIRYRFAEIVIDRVNTTNGPDSVIGLASAGCRWESLPACGAPVPQLFREMARKPVRVSRKTIGHMRADLAPGLWAKVDQLDAGSP
jgi:hypothetical protein